MGAGFGTLCLLLLYPDTTRSSELSRVLVLFPDGEAAQDLGVWPYEVGDLRVSGIR